MKRYLSVFILILILHNAHAQFSSSVFIETGENYVSSGIYTDITGNISAKVEQWEFGMTSGLTLSEARQHMFNALSFDLSRRFKLNEISFNGKLFYLWKPFSETLHEQNAGFLIACDRNWLGFEIGLNTRIYNLTDRVVDLNNYLQTTLWEPLNLMYKFTWNQPFSEKIHFSASITNFETFIIQQETNPMIITKLDYKLTQSTKLNLGVGYLQSGLMNIRVNYFGYFLRGGAQWEF